MGDVVTCLICNAKYHSEEKRCPQCRAAYPQRQIDPFNFYDQLYDDKWKVIDYLRRVRIYETIVKKILRLNKDMQKISFLDIGASVGISIVLLEQYGKARGIELNLPNLIQWHKLLGIEHAMMYINKDDKHEFYAKNLNEKIEFIFLIDTLRCISSPTLIDALVKFIGERGALVIKEVNPDNRRIFEDRISGRHGDSILYSPKTIRYLARKNEFDVNWYLTSSSIDNLAIKIPYSLLQILRPPTYVAVLRRKV